MVTSRSTLFAVLVLVITLNAFADRSHTPFSSATLTRIDTGSTLMFRNDSLSKKKVLVGIFGVCSRSFRYTWPQIVRMIIQPLDMDYDVDIYIQNNQVDNIDRMDGEAIQSSGRFLAQTHHKVDYVEFFQSEIDNVLSLIFKKSDTYFPGFYEPGDPRLPGGHKGHRQMKLNGIRQLYQEQKIADYIMSLKNNYQAVVILNSDLYPLLPISSDDLNVAANLPNTVATSVQQDCGGITNAFYMGSPLSVASALGILQSSVNQPVYAESYEKLLFMHFKNHGISRLVTNMPFCKMRNNHQCVYSGQGFYGSAYMRLDYKHRSIVKNALSEIQLTSRVKTGHLKFVFYAIIFVCLVRFAQRLRKH